MHPTKIELNGRKIAIRSSGSGEKAMVFIHGASSSSATWLPQLKDEVLQNRYRMIAIDLPGHGGSDWSKDLRAYELKELAEVITDVVSALHLNDFVLIGLSYGSTVIGEIAHPIAGCVGIMLVSPFIMNNEVTPDKILKPNLLGHVMVADNPPDNELKQFIACAVDTESVAERFYHTYRSTDPAFRKELGNTMSGGWTDELSNIQNWRVPVCVVFGKAETLIKSDYLNHYAALWNSSVYIIEKAGHIANEENPTEFNKILTRFVSAVLE